MVCYAGQRATQRLKSGNMVASATPTVVDTLYNLIAREFKGESSRIEQMGAGASGERGAGHGAGLKDQE